MSFAAEIIAVGKLKQNSPFYPAFQEYERRLTGKLSIIEIEGQSRAEELDKIAAKINPASALVILDEKGKTLPSVDFAKKLEELQQIKSPKFQFIIGGADGLNDDIRNKADLLISFGSQTWPHLMARVMLVEQLYRAQQILANHPYHRE